MTRPFLPFLYLLAIVGCLLTGFCRGRIPAEATRTKAQNLWKYGTSAKDGELLNYTEYEEFIEWDNTGFAGVHSDEAKQWKEIVDQFRAANNSLQKLVDELYSEHRLDALVAEMSAKHGQKCNKFPQHMHLKCCLKYELEGSDHTAIDSNRKRLYPAVYEIRRKLEVAYSYKLDMGAQGEGWSVAPCSLFNLNSLTQEQSSYPGEKRKKLSHIFQLSLAKVPQQETKVFETIYEAYDTHRVDDMDVTVVGASLAGFLGTLEHLRRGMRVTLVEMRPSYERSYYLVTLSRLTNKLRWFLGPRFDSLYHDDEGWNTPPTEGIYYNRKYNALAQIGSLEEALMRRMLDLASYMDSREKEAGRKESTPLRILRPVSFERVDVHNDRFVALLKVLRVEEKEKEGVQGADEVKKPSAADHVFEEDGETFIRHETNVIICATGYNDPNCRDRHKGHRVNVTREAIFANATMIKGKTLADHEHSHWLVQSQKVLKQWEWTDKRLQAEKFGDWLAEKSKCLPEEERRRYGDNEHFAKLIIYGMLAKKSDPDEFEVDANSGRYTWYREWVQTFDVTALLYEGGVLSKEKFNLSFVILNRAWNFYTACKEAQVDPGTVDAMRNMQGLQEICKKSAQAEEDLSRITYVFAALLKRYRREEQLHWRKGDAESIAQAKECRAEWGRLARKMYRALFERGMEELYFYNNNHLNMGPDGEIPMEKVVHELNFNPKDGTSISPIFQHNLKSVPAGRGAAYFEWRAAPSSLCLLLYSLGINGANPHFSASLSAEMASMEAEWMAQLVRRAADDVYPNPMKLGRACDVTAMSNLVNHLNSKWQHAKELILHSGGFNRRSVRKLDLEEDAVKFLRARREMCEAVNDAMAKEGGQLRIGDFLVKVSKDGGAPVTPEDPSFRIHVQHITSGGDGKSMEFEAMVTSYGEVGVVGKPNYGDLIYETNPLGVKNEPTHSFGALWPTYLYLINYHIEQLRPRN